MTCAGCSKTATHWVEINDTEYQENCTSCMLEAMCAEPVKVINMEALEAVNRGKSIARTA